METEMVNVSLRHLERKPMKKNIFGHEVSEPQWLTPAARALKAQVVPITPDVKLAKTCKLSLSGVTENLKTEKTADPPCYNSPVSQKTDPAVDAAGLFENQIRRTKMEYHIQKDEPCLPHWPKGAWSLYQISGDQIADRTVREKINPKGYYEGGVIARHGWCGYIGMFETLPELMAAIEADQKNRKQYNG